MNNGKVLAISVSERKGIVKSNVDSAELIENFGIKGDAHAGEWHRQISLLAYESIQKIIDKGLPGIVPGIFAENITTENIDLLALKIGDKLIINDSIELEITQIGKECHTRCAIYQQAGDCVMPREGLFARVLKGGNLSVGDQVYYHK